MKDWISLLVQLGPVVLVMWWLGRSHGHQGRMILRDGGPALIVAGLCSLIGAKYFGLSVFGKTTVGRGEEAIDGAIIMIGFGIFMLAFHYALFALIPAIARLFATKK